MTEIRPLLSLLLFFLAAESVLAQVPAPPVLRAGSYILMEQQTGEILAGQNLDRRVAPASLTKLMTGYILADRLAAGEVQPDEEVRVSERAWAQNPLFQGSSRMFIEPGKPVRIADLHRGIVISSGNDACVAVAEYLSGDEEDFVVLMNSEAQRLGMRNTHFANSHGLPAAEHYSSAQDIALLSQSLIRDFPESYALYAEKEFTYNGIRQTNRNRLLWEMEDVDGIKTGHTQVSGYSLATSAVTDGMRLIAVIFGSESSEERVRSARRLLRYGFRYYTLARPVAPGAVLGEVRIWGGEIKLLPAVSFADTPMVLRRDWSRDLRREVELQSDLQAPVEKGTVLGKLRLSLDGELLFEEPLLAARSVAARPWWSRWIDQLLFAVYSRWQSDA